jgi:hypothetical protein
MDALRPPSDPLPSPSQAEIEYRSLIAFHEKLAHSEQVQISLMFRSGERAQFLHYCEAQGSGGCPILGFQRVGLGVLATDSEYHHPQ